MEKRKLSFVQHDKTLLELAAKVDMQRIFRYGCVQILFLQELF